jgi:hypothetical protein
MDEEVHTDFDAAFSDGVTLLDVDGVRLVLRTVPLGELAIASGAIAVGDAFTGLAPVRPPSGAIAPGAYPVELALVRFEDDGICQNADERVAAARVRLAAAPAVRWVRAEHGAGVDTGTVAFTDGDVPFAPDEAEGEALEARLQAGPLGPSVVAARATLGARTVLAFSSGLGDGIYPAFWGLDAGGAPVALCYDFGLLITAVTDNVVLGWPLARGAIREPRLAQHGVRARVPWLGARRLVYRGNAFARWRLPDGTWRRPRTQALGAGGRAVALGDRPDGAELVLRVTLREAPCARAR